MPAAPLRSIVLTLAFVGVADGSGRRQVPGRGTAKSRSSEWTPTAIGRSGWRTRTSLTSFRSRVAHRATDSRLGRRMRPASHSRAIARTPTPTTTSLSTASSPCDAMGATFGEITESVGDSETPGLVARWAVAALCGRGGARQPRKHGHLPGPQRRFECPPTAHAIDGVVARTGVGPFLARREVRRVHRLPRDTPEDIPATRRSRRQR